MQTLHECKLLSLYQMMNEYSLINVCKKTYTETTSFAIDGIITFRNNPTNIGFTRTFADPYTLGDFVTDAKEHENGIIISCGEEQYVLSPIKSKSEQKECALSKRFPIEFLISEQYIDESLVEIKDNTVYMPVSLSKLGAMSKAQKIWMQHLIDDILNGSSEQYQFCRVPAFSIKFAGSNCVLCGHIYDLLNNIYKNHIVLFDSRCDFLEIDAYEAFISYANSFRT